MCTLRNRHHNNNPFFFFILLLILSIFLLIPTPISSSDTTTLVYKGCADQKLQDPSGIYSQNLKSLLSTLIAQSSQKNFAATTAGDGGSSIAGSYQCRGDLSTSDCYTCVSRITDLLGKLCGGDVAAARVQLSGCYLRYEVVGFKEVPRTQLLYKVCGSRKAGDGVGFEGKRDSAFEMVESGVKSNNGLFYTGSYQSLYVLGQCEGDLGSDECGDCIRSAEEQVKVQCGDSISAQVYLQGCYVSYSYYPNGVPSISSSSSSSTTGSEGGGHGGHTERTVALAVGGFAAVGFLVACLLFLKSAFKKRGGKR